MRRERYFPSDSVPAQLQEQIAQGLVGRQQRAGRDRVLLHAPFGRHRHLEQRDRRGVIAVGPGDRTREHEPIDLDEHSEAPFARFRSAIAQRHHVGFGLARRLERAGIDSAQAAREPVRGLRPGVAVPLEVPVRTYLPVLTSSSRTSRARVSPPCRNAAWIM